MKDIVFILCIVLSLSCKKESTSEVVAKETNPMISYSMFSPIVHDTLVIDVSFPSSYQTDSTRSYPVLYMTDGYWRRGQHQPIHDMAKSENVEEMIIVGIGYPDHYDPNVIRVRDLINHADRFLDFILTELIPRTEKDYRTTTDRTLWGSSYGGYFGMYILFNYAEKTKGVFGSYIIASPAVLETTNCEGVPTDLFGYETMLSSKTTELSISLYVTVGEREDLPRFLNPFKQLVKVLEDRHYTGFLMKSFIDPGKDHYTVWEPTLYEGVRMFCRK
jgi:predicted alpha/beta superfamily hydrolase